MGNWCLSFLSTVYKELDPDPWLATNVQKILMLNVGIGDGTHVSGNFTLSGRSHWTTEAPHLSLRENVLQHDNNLI